MNGHNQKLSFLSEVETLFQGIAFIQLHNGDFPSISGISAHFTLSGASIPEFFEKCEQVNHSFLSEILPEMSQFVVLIHKLELTLRLSSRHSMFVILSEAKDLMRGLIRCCTCTNYQRYRSGQPPERLETRKSCDQCR